MDIDCIEGTICGSTGKESVFFMKKAAVWKGLFSVFFVCAAGIFYMQMTKPAGGSSAGELIRHEEALQETDAADGASGKASDGADAADGVSEKAAGGASESASDGAGTVQETDAKEASVYVHVCGAVEEPGVYALAAGSRFSDAVAAAGGFTPDAAQDYLNLAQLLSDGQKVYVPTKEEAQSIKTENLKENASVSAEDAFPSGEKPQYVNINTAAAAELTGLPGIGKVKAEAIVAYRNAHGAFSSCEELMQVPGIKESVYEKLRDKITAGE